MHLSSLPLRARIARRFALVALLALIVSATAPADLRARQDDGDAGATLTLSDGGQFVFWSAGDTTASAVFRSVKIAWLFDEGTWIAFNPILGSVDFPISDGTVLWVVSVGPQTINIGAPAEDTDDEAPAEPRWLVLASIAGGPRQETGVVALNGEIYLIGGFDADSRVVATVEAYDPQTDRWRRTADLPLPLHHANVAVVDGALYVVGFLSGGGFTADGRVFAYDPAADVWTTRTSMPSGTERGASAVAVVDGKIYVAGGFRNAAVRDVSAYDPATDTWEILPDLPAPRDHVVGGAIDGVIYVAGGRDSSIFAVSGAVYAFDPAAGRWQERASMPTPRGGAAAAVLDGRLYLFGGEGDRSVASGVFDQTEAYDPLTDRWESLPPMPTPRHGTGAAALDGRIYVPGGADVQGFAAVDTSEAFVP